MPLDRREALAVLCLPPSADAATIRRTYRRLVRDHHPDVGGDPAAFHELQAAYEALADHSPSGPAAVRRGRPSRHHVAWSAARDGRRPTTEVAAIDWDAPPPQAPSPLDPTGLAIRLATVDDATGEAPGGPASGATDPAGSERTPVCTTHATSRAPGSRLNRVAASLSPDLTASLTVSPDRDDRGAAVVATELTAGSRRARRALDTVALDGVWMRTRGSASTTLRSAITPDVDPRRTALRVVEPLDDLLERLGWPLSSWVLTPGTPP